MTISELSVVSGWVLHASCCALFSSGCQHIFAPTTATKTDGSFGNIARSSVNLSVVLFNETLAEPKKVVFRCTITYLSAQLFEADPSNVC